MLEIGEDPCSGTYINARASDVILYLLKSTARTNFPGHVFKIVPFCIITTGEPAHDGYTEMLPPRRAQRRAGVIMHPTSLPGHYGIGDLGKEAFAFIDWLADAKMQIWQILPLVPPGRPIPGFREDYWSPYSGRDAHCGNTLIISLDELVADGLLTEQELPQPYNLSGNVDFSRVAEINEPLIARAAKRLLERSDDDSLKSSLATWRSRPEIKSWIEEAALFDAICNDPNLVGKDWWDWPEEFRRRDPAKLEQKRASAAAHIEEFCATQFLFDKQWLKLKTYANSQGISIIGDMPIYVGGHSADVWANQSLFLLGDDSKPTSVAGVPPDAFSEDGQLWGNPLYDWRSHSQENYRWWAGRIGRALQLHDEVRIDHFRAFAAYWSVPASAKTAKNGSWIGGPGKSFFDGVEKVVGDAPIVAEDLGVITKDVVDLREAIKAPGMVVLQFAWGGDRQSPHLPHNFCENSFCYPGTHDNQTTEGWYENVDEATKMRLANYAGISDAEGAAWGLIRLGMSSVSKACVFTMQDVLGLGDEARMNTPGVADGNWAWRIGPPGIFATCSPQAKKLASLATCFDRAPPEHMTIKKNIEVESPKANDDVTADGVGSDANRSSRQKFFGMF